MAAPKRFPTLVQLEQREGTLFEVLGNLTKRPYWFHSEYLKSPRAIHLEAWLVEAIFGLGGEHIPHVECVSQTLLHVNQWDPDGEAEILIFGRPYYQKDVYTMIMNLADYHRQLRAQSTGPGTMRRSEKPPAREAATQRSPSAVRQAATHLCPGEAREAGTQRWLSTQRQVRAFGFLAARGRSLSRLGQVLPLCSFTARIWLCKVRDLSGRRVCPHGKPFQA
ncbi:KHDC3-like protein [Neophocaena asiaeorientalis asiaeorientalis]|uniref:KHDC3-like protein n=1 Tax=Neophocaena asiaeorientalis asiaeorientalis TaxID=1706337 RepID=A0A341AEX4_NEOAA|nr:KHDC3-like protein [Neophocaena asiaeorientalis asiaeorientalis]